MVIGISGTTVRLADISGEVAAVTVSGLLADRGFAVLDARPRPRMRIQAHRAPTATRRA